MQKGAAPILIIAILGIMALAGYLLVSKVNPPAQQSDLGESLTFDKYQIGLPQGYKAEGIVSSGIDEVISGACSYNPPASFNTPCKYAVIKNLEQFMVIVIADTPKWELGGGGYITTVTEKLDLGPKGYESEFSSVWIGEVDANAGPTGAKHTLDNGHPVLYYITGCLRSTLCIHINAKQAEEGNAYADNSWQFAKFKEFVNSLKISSTQGKKSFTAQVWKMVNKELWKR